MLLLLLSAVAVPGAGAADATPAPEAAAAAGEATPEVTPAVEELPPLDCKTAQLLEKIESWPVDCVALWLENLGFPELRTAFTGNKIDGAGLKSLTMEKLADDYGVSDEDQRKKIFYNLKDVLRKDNTTGNTNNWAQMFFWLLPILGISKYFSLKYEKQIEKAMKRYKKWQEARNPPKPVEPVVYDDGTNEWTNGLNKDVGLGSNKKKDKKDARTPDSSAKKRTKKVD